jgi:hypothetical protein
MHVLSNMARFKKIMIPSNQPSLTNSVMTDVPATTNDVFWPKVSIDATSKKLKNGVSKSRRSLWV